MSATEDAGRGLAGGSPDAYARLFDDAPFVVSVHEGPDHLYRFTNARGRDRMSGKPYLGRPFRAVWPSLALMGLASRYDQAFSSGEPVTLPTCRVPPMPSNEPGSPPRWARQSLHPWRGSDGAVRGVVSLVHDVEAETQAEEAGRRAALRLDAALDASAVVGVWDWDTGAGTVHADAGLAALFGLEDDAAAGPLTPEQFAAAMHPDDRDRVFERIERTARRAVERHAKGQGSADYADEFRAVTPDGRVRFLQTVGHGGLGNEDGCVIHGLTFDVTAKREAEAAILDSEARLDAALRASGLGVVETDKLTGAVQWDARARTLWGFGPGETVTSDRVWARIHPADADAVRRATEDATARAHEAADGVARYQLRHRVVRGEDDVVWVRATGTVRCLDGQVARIVGTLADVSEEEARRAARVLSARELGHRIRNTLTVVQAIAGQTFRGVDGAAEALRVFTGRLQAFAASQADLAEGGGEQAEQGGDLEGVVRRAAGACAPTEQFEIAGPPVCLAARGAQMMALAVHELCTNATKYGALSVPEGRVRIAWTRKDGLVRMVWTEAGGPPVAPPERRGFGSTLIEQSVAGDQQGAADLDYRPEGLVCTLTFTAEAETGDA